MAQAVPSDELWQRLLDLSAGSQERPLSGSNDRTNDCSKARPPDLKRNRKWSVGNASLALSPTGQLEIQGALSLDDTAALALLSPIAGSARIVIAQLGQSLDGRIATASGDSCYINGPASRAHLHRLRALVDAVVIGVGTAIADQPALTVRHVSGSDPQPVVLDPRARLPARGPLFDPVATPRLLVLTGPVIRPEQWPPHVQQICLPLVDGGFSPAVVLARLAEMGLARVLIEGGARTVSRFIDAGALDRLHLLIAPLLVGSGPAGIELAPIDRLAEARRPTMFSYGLDDELVVDVVLAAGDASQTSAPGRATRSSRPQLASRPIARAASANTRA